MAQENTTDGESLLELYNRRIGMIKKELTDLKEASRSSLEAANTIRRETLMLRESVSKPPDLNSKLAELRSQMDVINCRTMELVSRSEKLEIEFQNVNFQVLVYAQLIRAIRPRTMNSSREGEWSVEVVFDPETREFLSYDLILDFFELGDNETHRWTLGAAEFQALFGGVVAKARESVTRTVVELGVIYDVVVKWDEEVESLRLSGMFGIKRWPAGIASERIRRFRYLEFEEVIRAME
ncbi:hypothetical protein QBC44DRAFT_373215 [Cladorrhinum sp. PSN332]|nr:hypothetical protein QBC44DRAFT_373215 [Cladorrhinum sp. PSN332]